MNRISDVRLNRPDLFKPTLLRPRAREMGRLMLTLGQSVTSHGESNVAAVIRTRNDEQGLEAWLKHIENERRFRKGRIDVVVVDTESSDTTKEKAKNFGATIVDIMQRDFTYPYSLNRGLEAVGDDVHGAFLSVGHALPILSNGIQAAARHLEAEDDIAGVHGDTEVHENAWRHRGS